MTTSNLTLFAALEQGAQMLKHAWSGVYFQVPPHAKIDAQVLLAAALNKPASYLFAHAEEMLSQDQQTLFFAFIARRAKHEPVAFILGTKPFFARDFLVTEHTLIPRPETELLVETAIEITTPRTLVVDVGTGSGAIGITLAKEKQVPVIAIDTSQDALDVAKKNAKMLEAEDHVSFLRGNLLLPFFPIFAKWPKHFPIDHLLICANLPYLTTNQWDTLDPNVKHFEPRYALVGGTTGLELYDELLMQIKAKRTTLPPSLTLLCEIDPAQSASLPARIHAHMPHARIEVMRDLARLPRLVRASV